MTRSIVLPLLFALIASLAPRADAQTDRVWWGQIDRGGPIPTRFEVRLGTNRFGRPSATLQIVGESDKPVRVFNVDEFPKGVEFEYRPSRNRAEWSEWHIEWLPGGETAEGWMVEDGERITINLWKGELPDDAPISAAATSNFDDDVEHWSGTLTLENSPPILFSATLESDGGDWSGRLWIPQQGLKGQALSNIEVGDDALSFEFDSKQPGDGRFLRWEISRAGGTGTFTQGPIDDSFTASRLTDSQAEATRELKRPQTPKPPFPYRTEEFALSASAGHTIAGTLTLPDASAFRGPFPTAVLFNGSGPQNRDSELQGTEHKPFAVLADHLARQGIASVRFADRGLDGSTGDFRSSTTDDFAADGREVVAWARGHLETDANRLGVIGHSEGGIVAALVAAENPDVKWAALLATPGVTGRELLPKQMSTIFTLRGAGPKTVGALNDTLDVYYQALIDGKTPKDGIDAAQSYIKDNGIDGDDALNIRAQLQGFAFAYGPEWTRRFLELDPTDAMKKMNQPTLVLQGQLDVQVDTNQNVPPIEAALKQGGASVTVERLSGLNHLFQKAETGNTNEYALIEETMALGMLEALSEWVTETTDALVDTGAGNRSQGRPRSGGS